MHFDSSNIVILFTFVCHNVDGTFTLKRNLMLHLKKKWLREMLLEPATITRPWISFLSSHCAALWPALVFSTHLSFPLGHIEACMTPVSDVLSDMSCIQMTVDGRKKNTRAPFYLHTHTHTVYFQMPVCLCSEAVLCSCWPWTVEQVFRVW